MPTITGTAASEVLTGSAGADSISDHAGGSDTLRGLAGNDILSVGRSQSLPVGVLRLEGGDGDDFLDYYVFNASEAVLDGGTGSDVFRIWAAAGTVQIVTGAGADVVDLGDYNPTWGGQLIVTDFTGGVGGDRISWGSFDLGLFGFASGWDGGNPFNTGYLSLTQVGADAVLKMDLDGAAGPSAAFTLITFRNTQAANITAWNFSGFNPLGGGVAGQVFTGTAAVDNLNGTNGDDVMSGLDGDDRLWGLSGNDRLEGGAGADNLQGGRGDDVVYGGSGNDSLYDLDNNDFIGGGGNDILIGGEGNDYISVTRFGGQMDRLELNGGDGDDELRINGNPGSTVLLDGGAGNDRIYLPVGLYGDLRVTTGDGVDRIYFSRYPDPGGPPRLVITDFETGAGANNDILEWDTFFDFALIGASRSQLFSLGFGRLVQDGDNVIFQLDRDGQGTAHDWTNLITFLGKSVSDFNAGHFGADPNVVPGRSFAGTNGADTIRGTIGADMVWGGDGDDILDGGEGDDGLLGEAGSDTLIGGDGDDGLSGGGGADVLAGGEGADRFNGGTGGELRAVYVDGAYISGGDVADFRTAARGVTVDLTWQDTGIVQDTGEGLDEFWGIEDIFGSDFNDSLTGWRQGPNLLMGFGGDDTLTGGGSGGDTLVGGDGDDTLIGFAGGNVLDGGAGMDTAVFDGPRGDYVFSTASDGSVTVTGRFGRIDTLRGVERILFSDGYYDPSGARMLNPVHGTSADDVLTGSAWGDIIDGGDGDDVITCGGGDDTIDGGAGLDTVVFAGPSGAYVITTTGATTTVSDILIVRDGTNTLTGVERLKFSDATLIVGAGGGQYFLGGAGADTLTGTNFNDQIEGGAGDDLLFGRTGDDTITGGLGNDRIDGGAGHDVLIVSGAFSDYRLLMNGDGFVLKGPDGGDRLTSIETIRFGDGRVLELNRMYGPDVDSGAWADGRIPEVLLSDGLKGGDQPLVLPGVEDDWVWSGKSQDGPEVLPALPDDDPLVLPGLEGFKVDGDEPLVLPGADEAAPLFANLEARLALAGDWMAVLDEQGGLAGEPANPRHDDWM